MRAKVSEILRGWVNIHGELHLDISKTQLLIEYLVCTEEESESLFQIIELITGKDRNSLRGGSDEVYD